MYRWDFDGDGINDYASLDSGNVTRVYETERARARWSTG